jgi:hypothetical protein
VAKHADACNLFAKRPSSSTRSVGFHRHCDEVGRPREQVEVTQLSTVLVGSDRAELDGLVTAFEASQGERREVRQEASTPAPSTSTPGGSRSSPRRGCRPQVVSLPDLDRVRRSGRRRTLRPGHRALPLAQIVNAALVALN